MSFKYYIIFSYCLLCSLATHAQKKPNVVFILTDDQGWGDLSLHGNPWLETPQLDVLAESGHQVKNFYVSPLCAPTRASILTGRYHLKTGVISVSKGMEVMDTEETTLAELFKANGYKTGIFGKWHNGQHYPNRPIDQGFDEFLGFMAGHWSNYFDTDLSYNDSSVSTQGYITDVLTDAAIKFIDSSKESPFFCYIPYNAPHSPHQVPDKYFNKYKRKGLDDELSSIYGMVENIDDNVGRVLNHLKDNDLEENTIIIFMSDNGPNGVRFNGIMKGIKGSVDEGGVRVPFFISWKGNLEAGKIIETPLSLIDIYPTLAELCELKPVKGRPIDGNSFASLLKGKSAAKKSIKPIYTHVNFMKFPVTEEGGGFRDKQYRLVYEKDRAQLFDLKEDPAQKNDLAYQKSDLTARYLQNYRNWFNASTSDLQFDRVILLSGRGVTLPAYEANISEGIKFKGGHAWAHDWIEKWDNAQDSIVWEINCQEAGEYIVEMNYMLKDPDVGSRILCSIGNVAKDFIIRDAFYSEQIESPDRIRRKEAYEMEAWNTVVLGSFYIPEGKQIVSLKALEIQKENVAELYSLRLKLAN